MDAPIIIGTGLAVLGSKDLLLKVLGPTADYVGGEMKGLVQKCNVNLDRIFKNAVEKLGARAEEDGSVNPRVLKNVIDEGRFCEDDLTREYYGGILASSKSRTGRDDRGVTLLALVRGLSVYQLRFHFMAYTIVQRLFHEREFNLGDGNDCRKMRVFVPMTVYEAAMGFTDGEKPDVVLTHCLFGLNKHDLLSDFASGNPEFLKRRSKGIDVAGILFSPTLPGAELFLWALGLPGASGRELLTVTISGSVSGIDIPDGAASFETLTEKLKQAEASKSVKAGG